MKRRDVLALVGGAAASYVYRPLAASAQQPAMPAIGFLSSGSADAFANRVRAFHRGLKEAGYVDGENVTTLYRWAEGLSGRAHQEAEIRNFASALAGLVPTGELGDEITVLVNGDRRTLTIDVGNRIRSGEG